MAKARKRLIVEGYVQGVFFRASTQEEAVRLGLSGWVRNRFDGTVEVMAEGEQDRITALERWCRRGPAGARVTGVRVEEELYQGECDGFRIRYS
jgi:acylphosphatase